MKKTFIIALSMLTFSACCGSKSAPAPAYPTDQITLRDGTQATITFFKYASLALEVGGKHIYIDPVGGFADYADLPKADLILVTHSHSDHLDPAAIKTLSTPSTRIISDRISADSLAGNLSTMRPGDMATPENYVSIEAVAAYNTTEGRLQFHPNTSSPSEVRASTSPATRSLRPKCWRSRTSTSRSCP